MFLRKTLFASLILTILSLTAAVPTYAGVVQLTSPAQLNPGGITVNYPAALGSTPPSPLVISAGGNILTFDTNGANFGRFVSDGTTYDFAAGTTLLDTLGNAPLTIDFNSGVLELGLRAQGNFPGADTFNFTLFNGAATLGVFSVGPTANGLASFIGARATGGDVITRIFITSTSSSGISNDFSFGPVTFGAAPAPIPEPATMTLLGVGLAGVAARIRRRRKASVIEN